MEILEQIARGLADAGEPLDNDYSYCVLCDFPPDTPHASDCPWLLAVAWVSGHPEVTDDNPS